MIDIDLVILNVLHTLTIALILVGVLFLSRKVRKGCEIPDRFKVGGGC